MSYTQIKTKHLQHIWSVLASGSVTDQDTNNLSIFNLVERLSFTLSPEQSTMLASSSSLSIPIYLQLITRLSKIGTGVIDFDIYTSVTAPDGEIIHKSDKQSVTIPEENSGMRLRGEINEVHVNESGKYLLSIYIREKGTKMFTEVNQVPLEITLEHAST